MPESFDRSVGHSSELIEAGGGSSAPARRTVEREPRPERVRAMPERHLERVGAAQAAVANARTQAPAMAAAPAKDELTVRIEKILEDGIAPLYAKLTPSQKEDFRRHGEETAHKLRRLMAKATFAVVEAWQLVRKWLQLLPTGSFAFIEQSSFIKAQQLAKLAAAHALSALR
jgi:hypothetical protein